MKITRTQFDMIGEVVHRRMRAVLAEEINKLEAQYNAAFEKEKEEQAAKIKAKHLALFHSIAAMNKELESLRKKTEKLRCDIKVASAPLLLEFHTLYQGGDEPDLSRPRFTETKALQNLKAEIIEKKQSAETKYRKGVDDILMKITFSDAPTIKAVLEEYGIKF